LKAKKLIEKFNHSQICKKQLKVSVLAFFENESTYQEKLELK